MPCGQEALFFFVRLTQQTGSKLARERKTQPSAKNNPVYNQIKVEWQKLESNVGDEEHAGSEVTG